MVINNFGFDGDHCPECAADWKAPHDESCSQFEPCRYPPGCDQHAALGLVLCSAHYASMSALLAPASS